MVSIWFFLWLVLSAVLLYFLGWTIVILYKQKAAWKTFAQKHKLRYSPGSFFFSPEVSGTMGNHTVSLFSGEHMAEDFRGSRKLMAIEVSMTSKLPFEGAVASGGMVTVVRNLRLKEEFRPQHKDWDRAFIVSTSDKNMMAEYLTPKRLDALTSLLKIKNSWSIMIFRDDVALLRFDTPDPLDNLEKLERITRKMLDVATVLELEKGEGKRIAQAAAKKEKENVELDIKDEDMESVAGIKLEEDEGDAA